MNERPNQSRLNFQFLSIVSGARHPVHGFLEDHDVLSILIYCFGPVHKLTRAGGGDLSILIYCFNCYSSITCRCRPRFQFLSIVSQYSFNFFIASHVEVLFQFLSIVSPF